MEKYYGLIEMSFSASVLFGLGFWQLWSLRREQRRDREKAEAAGKSTDAA